MQQAAEGREPSTSHFRIYSRRAGMYMEAGCARQHRDRQTRLPPFQRHTSAATQTGISKTSLPKLYKHAYDVFHSAASRARRARIFMSSVRREPTERFYALLQSECFPSPTICSPALGCPRPQCRGAGCRSGRRRPRPLVARGTSSRMGRQAGKAASPLKVRPCHA